jgi:mRNA-degrading endonuclease YafQ of YafQ-DinJ toxin-antitoxin module
MPAYDLLWTPTFERSLRGFLRRRPGLAGLVSDVLHLLEDDPLSPRLRMHRLKGKHTGKQAVRLTYSDRIVLVLRATEHEIVLLDIGPHDAVYR